MSTLNIIGSFDHNSYLSFLPHDSDSTINSVVKSFTQHSSREIYKCIMPSQNSFFINLICSSSGLIFNRIVVSVDLSFDDRLREDTDVKLLKNKTFFSLKISTFLSAFTPHLSQSSVKRTILKVFVCVAFKSFFQNF